MSNQLYFVPLYFLSAMLSANFHNDLSHLHISKLDLSWLKYSRQKRKQNTITCFMPIFGTLLFINHNTSANEYAKGSSTKQKILIRHSTFLSKFMKYFVVNKFYPSVFCENLIKCTLKICSVFQQSPRETWTFVLIMLVLINRIF